MKRLSAIFSDSPGKWGLKGELQLWEEFKARFAHQNTPQSEEKFLEELYAAFEELTGRPVQSETFISVSRYKRDGMATNMVDPWNWRAVVIPALARRYREHGEMH